jgi:anti-sigma-K factor RskA
MDCQEFEALSGAYVLDAITDDERWEADAHLAQCPNCPRKLRELQAVVNLLPLSLPPVEPPSDLKKRLFAAIHAEAPPPPKTIMLPQRPQQTSRRAWWRLRETRLLIGVAALLCILLGGMLVWNIALQQQLALQAHAAPSSIAYTLRGKAGENGELIYFPQMHLMVLVMHELPTLQGTQVYQGWLLEKQHPTSIGLLHMQNETALLNFTGDVKGYDTITVSVEPGPEASRVQPTGEIIASGSLGSV